MDKKCRQHEQIVLYPEERDGRHCIRIDYAGNPTIAHLLCSDHGVIIDNAGIARIYKKSSIFLNFMTDIPHTHTLITAGFM